MPVNIKVTSDSRQARADLVKVEQSLQSVENTADRMGSTVRNSMGAIGGAIALAPIILAGKAAINMASVFETLDARLVTVTGSTQKAAEAFGTIKKLIVETPFAVKALADGYARLAATGNAAFKSSKGIEEGVRAISDAVAAIGGGDYEFKGVSIAFERMSTEGRITAERLNQLADAGIPLTKIADKLGMSMAELRLESEKGSFSFERFYKAFLAVAKASDGFAGAAARQNDTIKGSISNFNDSIELAADKLIRLSGLNKVISKGFKGSGEAIEKFTSTLDVSMAAGMANIAEFATEVQLVFLEIESLFKQGGRLIMNLVPEFKFSMPDFVKTIAEKLSRLRVSITPTMDISFEAISEAIRRLTAKMKSMADTATPMSMKIEVPGLSTGVFDTSLSALKSKVKSVAEGIRAAFLGTIREINSRSSVISGRGEPDFVNSARAGPLDGAIKGSFPKNNDVIPPPVIVPPEEKVGDSIASATAKMALLSTIMVGLPALALLVNLRVNNALLAFVGIGGSLKRALSIGMSFTAMLKTWSLLISNVRFGNVLSHLIPDFSAIKKKMAELAEGAKIIFNNGGRVPLVNSARAGPLDGMEKGRFPKNNDVIPKPVYTPPVEKPGDSIVSATAKLALLSTIMVGLPVMALLVNLRVNNALLAFVGITGSLKTALSRGMAFTAMLKTWSLLISNARFGNILSHLVPNFSEIKRKLAGFRDSVKSIFTGGSKAAGIVAVQQSLTLPTMPKIPVMPPMPKVPTIPAPIGGPADQVVRSIDDIIAAVEVRAKLLWKKVAPGFNDFAIGVANTLHIAFKNVSVMEKFDIAAMNLGNKIGKIFGKSYGIKDSWMLGIMAGIPLLIAATVAVSSLITSLSAGLLRLVGFSSSFAKLAGGAAGVYASLKWLNSRLTELNPRLNLSDFVPDLDDIMGSIGRFGTYVKGVFFSIWDEVVGHSTWPDLINGVIEWSSRLLGGVKPYFSAFYGYVSRMFTKLSKSVKGISFSFGGGSSSAKMGSSLNGMFDGAQEKAAKFFSFVGDAMAVVVLAAMNKSFRALALGGLLLKIAIDFQGVFSSSILTKALSGLGERIGKAISAAFSGGGEEGITSLIGKISKLIAAFGNGIIKGAGGAGSSPGVGLLAGLLFGAGGYAMFTGNLLKSLGLVKEAVKAAAKMPFLVGSAAKLAANGAPASAATVGLLEQKLFGKGGAAAVEDAIKKANEAIAANNKAAAFMGPPRRGAGAAPSKQIDEVSGFQQGTTKFGVAAFGGAVNAATTAGFSAGADMTIKALKIEQPAADLGIRLAAAIGGTLTANLIVDSLAPKIVAALISVGAWASLASVAAAIAAGIGAGFLTFKLLDKLGVESTFLKVFFALGVGSAVAYLAGFASIKMFTAIAAVVGGPGLGIALAYAFKRLALHVLLINALVPGVGAITAAIGAFFTTVAAFFTLPVLLAALGIAAGGVMIALFFGEEGGSGILDKIRQFMIDAAEAVSSSVASMYKTIAAGPNAIKAPTTGFDGKPYKGPELGSRGVAVNGAIGVAVTKPTPKGYIDPIGGSGIEGIVNPVRYAMGEGGKPVVSIDRAGLEQLYVSLGDTSVSLEVLAQTLAAYAKKQHDDDYNAKISAAIGKSVLAPQVPKADTSMLSAQLAAAEVSAGLPKGLMSAILKQEIGGSTKYLDDPAKYHYEKNADGKRIAGHTGKVSTAFGPFGILDSTAANPGYGLAPLVDKSLPEQIKFASKYVAARSKSAGGLKAGLAGYGEGEAYSIAVLEKLEGFKSGKLTLADRPVAGGISSKGGAELSAAVSLALNPIKELAATVEVADEAIAVSSETFAEFTARARDASSLDAWFGKTTPIGKVSVEPIQYQPGSVQEKLQQAGWDPEKYDFSVIDEEDLASIERLVTLMAAQVSVMSRTAKLGIEPKQRNVNSYNNLAKMVNDRISPAEWAADGGSPEVQASPESKRYGAEFYEKFNSGFQGGVAAMLKGKAKPGEALLGILDGFTSSIIDMIVKSFTDKFFESSGWKTAIKALGVGAAESSEQAGFKLGTTVSPPPLESVMKSYDVTKLPEIAGGVEGLFESTTFGMEESLSQMWAKSADLSLTTSSVMLDSAADTATGVTDVFGTSLQGLKAPVGDFFSTFGAAIGKLGAGAASIFSSVLGALSAGGGGGGFMQLIGIGMSLFGGGAASAAGTGSSMYALSSGGSALGLKLASGGPVFGAGTATSDSIPAMLSHGEFVINAKATAQNRELLERINSGKLPKFATGGLVGGNSTGGLSTDSSLAPRQAASGGNSQEININITGDISRQTKSEIYKMLPDIANGVNGYNREKGNRR